MFGDGSKVHIEGKGSIIFQCKNGQQRKLQYVYYISSQFNNIISLVQLAENGEQILIHGSFLWVRDVEGRLLTKVKQSPNRVYKIILNDAGSRCIHREPYEQTWLWHARMDHIDFTTLKHMPNKNLVYGLTKIDSPTWLCEGCIVEKKT